ncbi:MAG: glutamate 5-kinase [Gracilibacter sp. BRH_c7a]|nr:MAG: glutamate 5-kinase [Gracilibacter sp. BRH_c7a]KUO66274.1 MAG: glutamate 5-kinase [Gracilibacter sp. BRH_c7a]
MNTLKRVVIKIGSHSLSSTTGGINDAVIDRIARTITTLHNQGVECVLVTSGAVAAGMSKLNLKEKPKDITGKQAVAAVGQGILIEKYSVFFEKYGLTCAQILLSRIDLVESAHYRNAQNTLERLLKFGVIPIVNENDTVAFEELCFGDNDKLSALVGGMIDSDMLILLTDVDGLFTANPMKNSNAEIILRVDDISKVKNLADGAGSYVGTGGMVTKLQAAEISTKFGISTFLMNAARLDEIVEMPKGIYPIGTMFPPCKHKLTGKKRWMAYAALSMGTIIIDNGAQKALTQEGKSLLASGVTGIDGFWERKDLIKIVNLNGEEIARGFAELSSEETNRAKGLRSDEILKLIPGLKSEELVHRDNMTVIM